METNIMQVNRSKRATSYNAVCRQQVANAIRALSMDAVQQANSGHPGAPMGMADIAEVLWNDFLKHNPTNPQWADRDRFILSNGHGSMLLYSLLHLTGYDLPLAQLRKFRQLNSTTPGHPEWGVTPGVETTTGPLGQGLANAVGMALAEHNLAAKFNRPNLNIVDHHTYVFLGDGCLMEGISHEVCSLAGTMGLGKLIAFYDDNGISIDGDVENWFTDDTPKRFEAYGWHVISAVDGHDPEAIHQAIVSAKEELNRPTMICCSTVIGYGSPNKQGGHNVHGAPLGVDEIAATRKNIDWPHPPFIIPTEIKEVWDAQAKGKVSEQQWNDLFAKYQTKYPQLAAQFKRRMRGELPDNWQQQVSRHIEETVTEANSIATRSASQKTLNAIGPLLPELLGGSADLTPSNNTFWQGAIAIDDTHRDGNYIHYGVREFGMSAIMNGVSLHGGFIPYGGTFFVFSDYARNALRVAALTKIRSIFVFTHDSIGLGEDGPTHQPVEHLASLRAMPNLTLWRPCDAVESAVAWQLAIENSTGPTALVFSRQNLRHIERNSEQVKLIARGGYILKDCNGQPDAILIATGSEIEVVIDAAKVLAERGQKVRVVSMPSMELFEAQDKAYRESVFPPSVVVRVAVEAGASMPWYKYVGLTGRVIAIDRFGESAPAEQLFELFGFTIEKVVEAVDEIS
jgi:transketolase